MADSQPSGFWSTFLTWLGFRAQARAAGASAAEANKAAGVVVAVQEVQKQADAEVAKSQPK